MSNPLSTPYLDNRIFNILMNMPCITLFTKALPMIYLDLNPSKEKSKKIPNCINQIMLKWIDMFWDLADFS